MSILKDKLGIQRELREVFEGFNVTAPVEVTGELVLPTAPVEDLAVEADLPTTVAKVNELLAVLRTAGVLGE